eukprot:TRINITY_DN16871_c0_g1_i2.p1 TRINITY_DN16871_c0_g1~~TRINITY_DN16871_c0_g1_i2.p1  ORF type:complete len:236 (-),score=23.73 TRINITY_DN16871_c0_g1_i2:272-904(-)
MGELAADFEYVCWADAEAVKFVQDNTPEEYAPMLRGMEVIEWFDYFRYLVLFKIGGIYSDIDVMPELGVNQWRVPDNVGLITGWETRLKSSEERRTVGFPRQDQVQQWTIASAPGHPLLADALELIKSNFRLNNTADVCNYTGPGVWTDAVMQHLGKPPERNDYGCSEHNKWISKQVVVMPVSAFSEISYPSVCHGERLVSHTFLGSWKP